MADTSSQNPFPSQPGVDGFQTIAGGCSDGIRVALYGGHLQVSVDIVRVPTVGLPLAFYLTYDSLASNVSTTVGNRWLHNLMMSLTVVGQSATFVNDTGKSYDFEYDGTEWVLSSSSPFLPMVLTQVGSDWRLTAYDNTYMQFDGSGALTGLVDRNGNSLSLQYRPSDGALIALTEDYSGRQVTLEYTAPTGGVLSTVTDPNGNVTTLVIDDAQDLVSVIGPAGCTTTFTYSSPGLLASRADAMGNTYAFTFGLPPHDQRLATVTDPEGHRISYNYNDANIPNEYLSDVGADGGTPTALPSTILEDARGYVWEYRFDSFGNLWRTIDPLGHQHRFYWDTEQKLLFESAGFASKAGNPPGTPLLDGPRVNPNNHFWRYGYDPQGFMVYQLDDTGMVSASTYDENQYSFSHGNLLTRTVGRASFGVQGSWVGQYGQDGWLLCAFDGTDSAPQDRMDLPSYVSSLSRAGGELVRMTDTHFDYMADPRTPTGPDGETRSVGFWQGVSDFEFTIRLAESKSFNLSLYTNAVDQGLLQSNGGLVYDEEFGREITFTVKDASGTQSFVVYNSAGGEWVTFPVTGNPSVPIVVTVTATVNQPANTTASLSAIMFDAFDDRTFNYGYDSNNNLTDVQGPLGLHQTFAYNADGTLATSAEIESPTVTLLTQ